MRTAPQCPQTDERNNIRFNPSDAKADSARKTARKEIGIKQGERHRDKVPRRKTMNGDRKKGKRTQME